MIEDRPSKAERRALLRERGWTSIGNSWRHPDYKGTFTLAAACQVEAGTFKDSPPRSGLAAATAEQEGLE